MDYDETLDVLKGLPGRIVEINVWRRGHEQQGYPLASSNGRAGRVEKVRTGGWAVWFEDQHTGPGAALFAINPTIFDGAHIEHSDRPLEQVIAEEGDQPTGTTWAIWIRQAGIVTEVLVYI
jgi:hypothetical protein